MTKSELDKFLKDIGYKYKYNDKDEIYGYNTNNFTITVRGKHIIAITVLYYYNAISHFIPLKNLTIEKFNVIVETLKEKIIELNKIL